MYFQFHKIFVSNDFDYTYLKFIYDLLRQRALKRLYLSPVTNVHYHGSKSILVNGAYRTVQGKKAATAYFSRKQSLHFDFTE